MSSSCIPTTCETRQIPEMYPLDMETPATKASLASVVAAMVKSAAHDFTTLQPKDLSDLALELGASLSWTTWALNHSLLSSLSLYRPLHPATGKQMKLTLPEQMEIVQTRAGCTISRAWCEGVGDICVKSLPLAYHRSLLDPARVSATESDGREKSCYGLLNSHAVNELVAQEALTRGAARRLLKLGEDAGPAPCVLLLGTVMRNDGNVHLVYPWVRGDTLFAVSSRPSQVAERLQLSKMLSADLLNLLSFLREAGVAHGDLKADNIMLVNSRFVCIDFGHASTDPSFLGGLGTTSACLMRGAFHVRPPEALASTLQQVLCADQPRLCVRVGGFAADAWAAGLLLFSVLCGRPGIGEVPIVFDRGHEVTRQTEQTPCSLAYDSVFETFQEIAKNAGVPWQILFHRVALGHNVAFPQLVASLKQVEKHLTHSSKPHTDDKNSSHLVDLLPQRTPREESSVLLPVLPLQGKISRVVAGDIRTKDVLWLIQGLLALNPTTRLATLQKVGVMIPSSPVKVSGKDIAVGLRRSRTNRMTTSLAKTRSGRHGLFATPPRNHANRHRYLRQHYHRKHTHVK
jgi:serine/threonine protein kinase